MDTAHHDKWLWLGLGLFTFVALRTIYNGRTDLLRLAEVADVKPEPRTQWEVTQRTEDAISATALFELWKGSTSSDIKRSAAKILIERALTNEPALRAIMADFQKDKASWEYQHAMMLERYVMDHTDSQTQALWTLKREEFERRSTPPRDPNSIDRRDFIGSSTEWTGYDTAADGRRRARPLLGNLRRARPLEPMEAEARRRRREAVVVNEGDRPITQQDIIQRTGGGAVVVGGDGARGVDPEIVRAVELGLAQLASGISRVSSI